MSSGSRGAIAAVDPNFPPRTLGENRVQKRTCENLRLPLTCMDPGSGCGSNVDFKKVREGKAGTHSTHEFIGHRTPTGETNGIGHPRGKQLATSSVQEAEIFRTDSNTGRAIGNLPSWFPSVFPSVVVN